MRSASIFAALACTVLVATAGCERREEQIAGLSIPVPAEMHARPVIRYGDPGLLKNA